jgi:hypothetical protein
MESFELIRVQRSCRMLPVLFDSKTTVNADADEIFPLLATI